MTLEELASIAFPSLSIRPQTRATYESVFRCHIGPHLGATELNEISRAEIQKILQVPPPQTARTALACIKTLMREGLALGQIEASPTSNISLKRPYVRQRPFLTVAELESRNLGKYHSQILFLAKHGLRWGEAVALNDEDFRDGMISINKSIHGPTKTTASVRLVPQISEFVPLPRSPKTLRTVLHPLGIHIHSLRHSYAYLLKSSGVHVTTAQRLMGHSSPTITLGIYTQFRGTELEDAALLMRNHLRKSI